uniref:Ig-like domain-containing protein n=1 Tax=Myripristis murdjan TaxID=586833 RepID=A0A667ZQ18_9TELE
MKIIELNDHRISSISFHCLGCLKLQPHSPVTGSCVVIPCSFAYSTSQPPDLRVIWYLYQSQGHPSVYDNGQSTIDRFRRGTSVIGSVKERNCSLHIDRLEMLHNQDRVYPWVDKNPITSYHAFHQSFFDKTTLLVQPQVSIISIPRVGERSSVSCRVRNTCPFAPPTLTLDGIHGDDQTSHTPLSDGIWETTLERTWDVQEEDDSVICTVSYRGGQTPTLTEISRSHLVSYSVFCFKCSFTFFRFFPGNKYKCVRKRRIGPLVSAQRHLFLET